MILELFYVLFNVAAAFFYISCWFYSYRVLSAKLQPEAGGTILCIIGCLFPPAGALIGVWYVFYRPTKKRESDKLFNTLKKMTDEQIVDLIDEISSGSVIAASSIWLKDNWHSLKTDEANKKWVNERRSGLLAHLPASDTAPA